MPADAAYFSVPPPMAIWSMAQNRPSNIIESMTLPSPRRMPARAPGSRYGALVMDSMPPATTMSAWPDWMSRSAIMIELMPDRQTLPMVVDGTDSGMPAALDGLAGGHLAGTGGEHLAHEHVVDVLGGDAGTRRAPP